MTAFQWIKARAGQFSQVLAMRLYTAGAIFLVTLLLGRLLGPSEFGAYVFAMGWLSIFLLFATLGFQTYTNRTLPALLVRETPSEAKGLVVLAASSVTLLSIVIGIIVALNHARFSEIPEFQAAVLIVSLLILPQALLLIRAGVVQGLGHPIAGQIPERIVSPTLLLLSFGACALLAIDLTSREVLLITVGVAVLSFLSGLPSLRSALRQIDVAPTYVEKSTWIVGTGKSAIAFAALAILSATDVIMLGLLSTPEETGFYGIAARFFLLMALPTQAAVVVLTQRAAKLHAEGDKDGLSKLATGVANRSFVSTVSLAVPATIAAFFVEPIFGDGFGQATVPILILVWGRVAVTLIGLPGPILATANYIGTVATVSLAAALINVGLNAALIPVFAANGAALATTLSFVFLTCGHAFLLKHRMGVSSRVNWSKNA